MLRSPLIEDEASGTHLLQALVEESLYAVTRNKSQADRIMRLHAPDRCHRNRLFRLPKEPG
jgi:hypothetical protein